MAADVHIWDRRRTPADDYLMETVRARTAAAFGIQARLFRHADGRTTPSIPAGQILDGDSRVAGRREQPGHRTLAITDADLSSPCSPSCTARHSSAAGPRSCRPPLAI